MAADNSVLHADLSWRSVAVCLAAFVLLVGTTALVHAAARPVVWIAVGSLIALALDPVVSRLEGRVRRRSVAVGIVVVVLVGGVIGTVALFAPSAVRQSDHLTDDLPRIMRDLGRLPVVGPSIRHANVSDHVQSFLQDVPGKLSGNSTALRHAATSALNGAVSLFATVLITITLLLDGAQLVERVRRLTPAAHREQANRLAFLAYRTIGQYFAGSLLIAAITGVIVAAVGLALGVPLAPALGAWVAIFDLIPQIGGAVGGVPFVVFAFTRGAGTGLACLLFFVVYLNIKNHVLHPIVIGRTVQLSPPATMTAALMGVSAGGVVGALVAVPLLGTAKAFYLELTRHPQVPVVGSTGDERHSSGSPCRAVDDVN